MTDSPSGEFSERLWPSLWLLIILLLLIPAVMLTITPLSEALALPLGIAVYLIIAGSLVLVAPTIRVRNGLLEAGSARIPLVLTREIKQLNEGQLRRLIGPEADARAFLLVRGHIHRGVRIEISDAADPTPYWVLTTRRPLALSAAIVAARAPEAPGSARQLEN